MIESEKPIRKNLKKTVSEYLGEACEILNYSKPYTQQLTHQTIQSVFIFVAPADFQQTAIAGAVRVPLKKLHTFGFPKVVHLFLSENSLL